MHIKYRTVIITLKLKLREIQLYLNYLGTEATNLVWIMQKNDFNSLPCFASVNMEADLVIKFIALNAKCKTDKTC